ncbi:hypothetical protein ACI6Q2_12015 [Chitinophagaceae bacterium LWZ2-11]
MNKSNRKLSVIFIALGFFLAHLAIDVFKIGIKDGKATQQLQLSKK